MENYLKYSCPRTDYYRHQSLWLEEGHFQGRCMGIGEQAKGADAAQASDSALPSAFVKSHRGPGPQSRDAVEWVLGCMSHRGASKGLKQDSGDSPAPPLTALVKQAARTGRSAALWPTWEGRKGGRWVLGAALWGWQALIRAHIEKPRVQFWVPHF